MKFFFYTALKAIIEENVIWNDDLGEWQLKCVAYTGNNMRKPKENDKDKNKVMILIHRIMAS